MFSHIGAIVRRRLAESTRSETPKADLGEGEAEDGPGSLKKRRDDSGLFKPSC